MRKMLMLIMGMLFLCGQLLAQNKTVTGRVTDDKGNPVAAATVSAKGARNATSTGPDGSFSLPVPSTVKSLVITAVGFATQEATIGPSGKVNILLNTEGQGLQEVVVVGYGTQKKAEITSSVTKVSGDKVANIPLSSVDQILQGKAAGVQSTGFSGQPGANQQIRIRGISSFSASSQPLYVVDGVQINSGDLSRLTASSDVLSNINPDDIESISILKDAAATAIYGSRGGNGVIVITTKRGKAGKTQFKLVGEVGNNTLGNVPPAAKPVNSQQWLAIFKEGYANTYLASVAGSTQAQADAAAATQAAVYGDGTVNTDWLSTVTRTGQQQQYNLSAGGGDEKTKFYVSGGYFKQEASTIAADFTRYSASINLDHNVGKKLSFSLRMTPTYSKENAPLSNGSQFGNPILGSFFLRPLQNPYNADGTLNISAAAKDFSSIYNPLYLAQNNLHLLNTFSGIGSAQAKYNFLNNLSFTSKFGVQYSTLEEFQYDNPYHGDGLAAKGRGYTYYTRYFLYDWINQADYRANLTSNKDLVMDAKVAYEAILSKGYFISAQSQNYPTSRLPFSANASTVTIGSATGSDYAFASAFANVAFSYKEKYILSGTIRRDGSSRFGSVNQYGNFPSASFAWNVGQENFMQNVKWISDLKLRASYGVAGNSEIAGGGTAANYAWRQQFNYGGGANYNGNPGGTFATIGNIDLTWEKDKQTDVGLDASFLKNKVNVVIDYYNKVSSDLLFAVPISQVTGFTSINQNIGKLSNKGIEITINATPITFRNFTWDISFNFTHNKNQLETLPPGQTQIINGQFLVKPGLDINTWYMRQWAGVDPATGNPLWYLDSSKQGTTTNYSNGVGSAPRVNTGKSANPKYYGGLSNTFTYKGFSVSADLYYNFGNYVWDQWGSFLADQTNPTYGKYGLTVNRWQKPGDITNVPKLYYGAFNSSPTITNSSSNATSTRFLYKGDYLRLRNITFGYNVSQSVIKRLHLSQVSFYVRGTNLWTKTYDKNLTIDPEQGGSSNTNGNLGVNNLNIFYSKAVTVGLNIGF